MAEDGPYIVAEEGYAASEVLSDQWPGCGRGDRWKDSHSFHLSSCRIQIEQNFGTLSWRWGLFWWPLRIYYPNRPSLVCARFHLNHVFREHGSARDCSTSPYGTDCVWRFVYLALNDSVSADQRGRRRYRERSRMRVSMTDRVKSPGMLRPDVAPVF